MHWINICCKISSTHLSAPLPIYCNRRYPSDLMAIREAHVFKYADQPALAFQCQIEILIKVSGRDRAQI